MNNHTVHIRLRDVEGAIIRTLGLIERRGYQLESCTVSNAQDDVRQMEVNVTSTRSGDLLKRQLERLHDVFHVELKPVTTLHTQHPHIRPFQGENQ